MTFRQIAAVAALAACLPAASCVAPTHAEDAAMIGARPTGLVPTAPRGAGAGAAFPSLGGDILAGAAPEILAKARAAQSEALTQALAKP